MKLRGGGGWFLWVYGFRGLGFSVQGLVIGALGFRGLCVYVLFRVCGCFLRVCWLGCRDWKPSAESEALSGFTALLPKVS